MPFSNAHHLIGWLVLIQCLTMPQMMRSAAIDFSQVWFQHTNQILYMYQQLSKHPNTTGTTPDEPRANSTSVGACMDSMQQLVTDAQSGLNYANKSKSMNGGKVQVDWTSDLWALARSPRIVLPLKNVFMNINKQSGPIWSALHFIDRSSNSVPVTETIAVPTAERGRLAC